MVVLHACEVPDEPTDGVCSVGRGSHKSVGIEAVDRLVHMLIDPIEEIDEEFVEFHG